jgi:HEAT repeat protein
MRYRLCCLWMVFSFALPAADSKEAWRILTEGAAESSPYKRAPAISALGTIPSPEARKLVDAALTDKEILVRLAAVSAMADRKSRADIPRLKIALDDTSGEVSFTAAHALWEMGDHSGRELIESLLEGERKPSDSFIKKQIRGAKTRLHDPKELMWLGAKEGAGFLFGPLGAGLGVLQMVMKDGTAPERALSATMLGEIKDEDSIEALGDALTDKSPLVRAAAAKALGGFRDPRVPPKLEGALDDKVDSVRYMVAASLWRTEQAKLRGKAPRANAKG